MAAWAVEASKLMYHVTMVSKTLGSFCSCTLHVHVYSHAHTHNKETESSKTVATEVHVRTPAAHSLDSLDV